MLRRDCIRLCQVVGADAGCFNNAHDNAIKADFFEEVQAVMVVPPGDVDLIPQRRRMFAGFYGEPSPQHRLSGQLVGHFPAQTGFDPAIDKCLDKAEDKAGPEPLRPVTASRWTSSTITVSPTASKVSA